MAFVRYTLAGGVATSTHYGVLVGLVEGFGLSPPPSAALGALCGALVAYVANRRFTFSSDASHRRALPRFLAIALLGGALNGFLVWVGTRGLAWHYLAAQVVATVLVLGLTFCLNRSWTFA